MLENFTEAIDQMLQTTAENPRLWAELEPGLRRAVLDGFPYSLIYTIEPGLVFVIALAHHSRRPGYWRGRVPG